MIAKDDNPVTRLPPLPLMLGVAAASALSIALIWIVAQETVVAVATAFLPWPAWMRRNDSPMRARPAVMIGFPASGPPEGLIWTSSPRPSAFFTMIS